MLIHSFSLTVFFYTGLLIVFESVASSISDRFGLYAVRTNTRNSISIDESLNPVSTERKCALTCAGKQNCVSYNYNNVEKTCELSSSFNVGERLATFDGIYQAPSADANGWNMGYLKLKDAYCNNQITFPVCPSNCKNDGICKELYCSRRFECICRGAFLGNTCEESVTDCSVWFKKGYNVSGVYQINLNDSRDSFSVFCDMDTDGGGWTVFQKRLDGSVDFYRGWNDFKTGFGNINGEFWLGNDYIHRITSHSSFELRVDMEDTTGGTAYAKYTQFAIASEDDKYRLTVGTYSGNAGDSLKEYHDNMQFTTIDQDNDKDGNRNCAVAFKGAWWHDACHTSNLNGIYLNGDHSDQFAIGVNWKAYKGYYYSLKRSEMKIRPVDF